MAKPRQLKANPAYRIFSEKLSDRPWMSWQGIAFRAAPLEYARVVKLLDGRGALKFGGRWSAPGTIRAVNLSLTQETALAESKSNFSYYNFPTDVRPKVVVGVRISLRNMLDLTLGGEMGRQNWLTLSSLVSEDWREANDAGCESMSQALGRAAHDLGAEGLLVPSAQVEGAVNLVFFPESLVEGATAEILEQTELERWLKKR